MKLQSKTLPVHTVPEVGKAEPSPVQLSLPSPAEGAPEPKRRERGRPTAASVDQTRAARQSVFDNLRDTIKAIWKQTALKIFGFLTVLGASPLTEEESAIIGEAISINVDLIAEDALENARRMTRWASVGLAIIILVLKILSIFRRRAQQRDKTESNQ